MYDAGIARFSQQDSYTGGIKDPLSLNLYIYCRNNPLIYDDPSGHFWHVVVGAAVGAVVGAGINFIGDLLDDGKINRGWKSYVGSAVEGSINGGFAAATGGLSGWWKAGIEGTAAFFGDYTKQAIENNGDVDIKKSAKTGLAGGVFSLASTVMRSGIDSLIPEKLIKSIEDGSFKKQIADKAKNAVNKMKNINMYNISKKARQYTDDIVTKVKDAGK